VVQQVSLAPSRGGACGWRSQLLQPGDVHALLLSGELDLESVPGVEALLRRAFGPFYFRAHLVVDLADVTLLDSSVVGFFVLLAGKVHREGCELVMTRPRGGACRVLSLTGLANVVPVYGTLAAAVEALAAGDFPLIPPPFEWRRVGA
jgi:anti-anti-sigma factor